LSLHRAAKLLLCSEITVSTVCRPFPVPALFHVTDAARTKTTSCMSSQIREIASARQKPSRRPRSAKDIGLAGIQLRIAVIGALSILALLTLFPLLQTGFTTKDDSEIALQATQHGESLRYAMNFAALQGRFYQAFSILAALLPHYYSNPVWHYSLYLGSILLNVLLFYFLVGMIFRSRMAAVFAAALCLTFLQNNWQHSILTSYRVIVPLGLTFFLGTLLFFFYWQRQRQLRFAILTGITYFLALLIYESFVVFFVVFLGLALHDALARTASSVRQIAFRAATTLSPIVLVLVVYLSCYFTYRFYHPSVYDGNQPAPLDISRILAVMWQYTVSTVPGYFYFRDSETIQVLFTGFGLHTVGLGELVELCRVEWAVKAVAAAGLSAAILVRARQHLTLKSFWLTLAAGVACLFAPALLVSLTAKYQDWVLRYHSLAYSAPSYDAYFAMIFLLVTVLLFLSRALSQWKILSGAYIFCVCVGIAVASLATDFYNYHITVDQQLSHLKWRTVDRFLQTEEFDALPSDSVILAPSLWRQRGIVANAETYWSRYLTQKSGKRIWVAQSIQQLGALLAEGVGRKGYFLAFEQEPKEPNQFVVFGKLGNDRRLIDGPVYASEFTLFNYSKNRSFTLIGEFSQAGLPVRININGRAVDEIENGVFFARVDQSTNREDFPKVIVNSTTPVDIAHLVVSFFPVELGRKGVEIIYGRGFHGLEENSAAGLVWNWSRAESEVAFVNYSDHPVSKLIQFQLTVFTPRTVALEVNEIQEQIVFESGGTKLVNLPNVILQPGENKLFLASDQPALPPGNGDSRLMAFGVQNLLVTDPGK